MARSRVGILPEVVGLYDHLTVREHLAYAGAPAPCQPFQTYPLEWMPCSVSSPSRLWPTVAPARCRQGSAVAWRWPGRSSTIQQNVVLDEPTMGSTFSVHVKCGGKSDASPRRAAR